MDYGMDFQGDQQGGYTNAGSSSGGGAPSSSQPARRSYDEQTLIPVTARMILRSTSTPDGITLEDGRAVASVKLVGATRNVADNSTSAVYEIEDGTGLIEVKQWTNDGDCSAAQEMRQQTLQDHKYLKICGAVKEYDGKKTILANSIRPLSTGNELTHHMLEVIYSAEQSKRADSIVNPVLSAIPSLGGATGPQITMSASNGDGSGSSLRDAVLSVFRSSAGKGDGVYILDCIKALEGKFSEADIRRMVDGLSDEGELYSTISHEHFQCPE